MSKNSNSYTDEFRDEAVDLLRSSGRPLKQVACELGVTANTLRNWRNARVGSRSAGVAGAEGAESTEMELRRLRRENAYLKRQRDILKKAASILSEDPQGGMR